MTDIGKINYTDKFKKNSNFIALPESNVKMTNNSYCIGEKNSYVSFSVDEISQPVAAVYLHVSVLSSEETDVLWGKLYLMPHRGMEEKLRDSLLEENFVIGSSEHPRDFNWYNSEEGKNHSVAKPIEKDFISPLGWLVLEGSLSEKKPKELVNSLNDKGIVSKNTAAYILNTLYRGHPNEVPYESKVITI